MIESNNPPSGCGYLGLLSLIASLVGSALGAAVYAAMHYSQLGGDTGIGGPASVLLSALFIFYCSIFVAVPVGLAVGIPLMALSRQYLSSHVVIPTLAFGIIGLLGGLAITDIGGGISLDNAELIFGACVGAMHPLVYGRANGVPWPKVVAASLLSAVVVPSLAYAGEDASNLLDSHAEFETLCADRYGSMAFVRDRADWERHGYPVEYKGKWRNQLQWRSLYKREDIVLLDSAHVLIARDYAYVPSGFAGWLTGGRRVERHCLSEKKGRDADVLRSRGFGTRPFLQDLAD